MPGIYTAAPARSGRTRASLTESFLHRTLHSDGGSHGLCGVRGGVQGDPRRVRHAAAPGPPPGSAEPRREAADQGGVPYDVRRGPRRDAERHPHGHVQLQPGGRALQAALPVGAGAGGTGRGRGAGGGRGRRDRGRLPLPRRGVHAPEAGPALLHQAGIHGQVQEEPGPGHGHRAVSPLPEGTCPSFFTSLLCCHGVKPLPPPELNQTDYRHCCLFQQLLLALAASRRSHHDDLSQHVAKCDARRLHDTKNSGAGSVVDEAVILEMFSKRSIPQLRLAFCSYKHIYGHDYTKALKINGSGEFEESLRVVVKCIYNPSKYYSRLLQRSMLSAATDKRMVTRAILGSDDLGIDEIRSAFKSSYGRNLADYIQENLPESDYRDFLVAVARGSVAP